MDDQQLGLSVPVARSDGHNHTASLEEAQQSAA